ncbi:probable histone-lysine N-methyltransferase Mes-4 [Drosophila novamexicana]|uniref:probable histone-lysine N-methyltransferase Mes-4 n=1 Tax=Drosophila novamexicana TaxID=47314 RepID=UPI0011E5D65F|nr:probable histone-lysine N-methyltransferase Mes-4 [Drosophila novamexicana]
MKLSANNTHTEMQDAGVVHTSTEATDNATAGTVAPSVVKTDADGTLSQPNAIQRFPGNLLLRNCINDAESATDSSEQFTEYEHHNTTDQQQTPPAARGRHRVKTLNRKRDLINLQSNLSPKYIGYPNANSPTVPDSVDKVRTTRRRNHALTPNRDGDSDVASPKTLLASMHMLASGAYLSPIDKLLIKNGANSPNSTGFEADAEDVTMVQPTRKQLKRKLKRDSKPKKKHPKEAPAEVTAKETSEHLTKDEQPHQKQATIEIGPTLATDKPEISIKVELTEEDAAHKIFEADEQIHVKTELKTAEQKDIEESQVESMFALPTATSTEIEVLKSPPDIEPANNSEQSMKSPSSISLDSAKGSSIVTDSGWPTYQVGDLYWGKLFTYCYWPCMVCPDQLGQIVGNPHTHPQRKSTDSAPGAPVPIQVHVRFFADNGRHNWIKSENLLPFAGLKAFEELREEARIKYGPRSLKYRQMTAKQNKLIVWRQAIEEANIVGQLPYAERMQKFYEIYENTITHNKEKRKYTKSVRQDTSDVGSSLYDSTDNLLAKSQLSQPVPLKRERSSSPFSPAFSPVKHNHQKRAKRRKLSGSLEAPAGYTPLPEPHDEKPISPDLVNYKNPEFGQLFDAIKEYVMVHRQEEKVEKVLLAVVRNIWSLKQLQLRELERDLASGESELLGSARLGSERGRGVGTIKRLSNRLKTMMLRRSITPVVTPSTAAPAQISTPESMQPERHLSDNPKVRKPIGRPIDEVVEDILQLDRKYLFRGLNREPVCKYCYEPGGDIQRCSVNCNSWLHATCLEQQRTVNTKAKKGPKTIGAAPSKAPEPLTSSSPVSEVEPTTTSTLVKHITGDEIKQEQDKEPLVCHECASGKSNACCICHQEQLPASSPPPSPHKESVASATAISEVEEPLVSNKLILCCQPMCSNKFHASCCKYWPQASISNSSTRCPMHVCHTCVSDDPSGKYQQLGSAKLTKCVKCPATYHQDSRCIPAGSRMLTVTHLICPRHNIAKADANLNVLWCYICVRGGELVCCETCPIAVHAHCRNIPIKTNESYICEECESGRLPLYGEIVWAKFNNFRWWPSIILPPTEIPSNILKKPHGANDFVVRFFGTNDHGWISRRRVYLYIEGDTGDGYKSKSLMSKRYTAGVEEATRFLKIIKDKRQEQAIGRFSGNKLYPPPYIKIKANKPVPPVRFVYNEEDLNICECKPGSEHPCGPESGCLNRMLFHECHPDYCHAGRQCENQLFELRKSPRLEVVYMNERGFGLVCREPIAEGDFIIEYVGEVINHAEFQRRMAQKTRDRDENFYFLGVEKDFIIDAGPKGNLARFMNHSCEPNCATQKWTVNCINRVGLFAIKDIPENTELTFNYLWDDLMNNGKKACFCGAKRCSGEIGGKLKDEEVKETKIKQLPRHKGIRIHVGAPKKKAARKSKSKHMSVDNVPPTEQPSDAAPASKEP